MESVVRCKADEESNGIITSVSLGVLLLILVEGHHINRCGMSGVLLLG